MKLYLLGTGAGNPSPVRFNSCSILETAGRYYMIDAGGPTIGLMQRAHLSPEALKGIFLSHLHEDHYGNISSVLKNRAKYLPDGEYIDVWLPEIRAGKVFNDFLLLSRGLTEWGGKLERLHYQEIHEGPFWNDGYLNCSAFYNLHLVKDKINAPSYGFRFEAEGKNVIYTGDLAADFSDFPVEQCKTADVCITELTHYKPENALPIFQTLPLKQLIFTHVAMANIPKIEAMRDQFPYPVAIASDGDSFEV